MMMMITVMIKSQLLIVTIVIININYFVTGIISTEVIIITVTGKSALINQLQFYCFYRQLIKSSTQRSWAPRGQLLVLYHYDTSTINTFIMFLIFVYRLYICIYLMYVAEYIFVYQYVHNHCDLRHCTGLYAK